MKKSGNCLKVYLALFLLIVLVAVFQYKEGFGNGNWLDMSSWFTTKDISGSDVRVSNERVSDDIKKNEPKDNYDDTYGSGLSGASYTTTETTNDASYNSFYKKLDEPHFN
jgi:hypothetical protein